MKYKGLKQIIFHLPKLSAVFLYIIILYVTLTNIYLDVKPLYFISHASQLLRFTKVTNRKTDQMRKGLGTKIKFFENCLSLSTQALTNFAHPKNTLIFNQMRISALLRGTSFFSGYTKCDIRHTHHAIRYTQYEIRSTLYATRCTLSSSLYIYRESSTNPPFLCKTNPICRMS